MVIVKGLLDADEHGQAGIDGERATLVVDDFGLVVSDNQSVLGQVLKEAFCLTSVHIEVEGICGNGEREDGECGKEEREP